MREWNGATQRWPLMIHRTITAAVVPHRLLADLPLETSEESFGRWVVGRAAWLGGDGIVS